MEALSAIVCPPSASQILGRPVPKRRKRQQGPVGAAFRPLGGGGEIALDIPAKQTGFPVNFPGFSDCRRGRSRARNARAPRELPARSNAPPTAARSLSSGSGTARAMLGPAEVSAAPTRTRADLTPAER